MSTVVKLPTKSNAAVFDPVETGKSIDSLWRDYQHAEGRAEYHRKEVEHSEDTRDKFKAKLIAELRHAHDHVADFSAYLKEHTKIGRSTAYRLLALTDGRGDKVREQERARKQKSRAVSVTKRVTDTTDERYGRAAKAATEALETTGSYAQSCKAAAAAFHAPLIRCRAKNSEPLSAGEVVCSCPVDDGYSVGFKCSVLFGRTPGEVKLPNGRWGTPVAEAAPSITPERESPTLIDDNPDGHTNIPAADVWALIQPVLDFEKRYPLTIEAMDKYGNGFKIVGGTVELYDALATAALRLLDFKNDLGEERNVSDALEARYEANRNLRKANEAEARKAYKAATGKGWGNGRVPELFKWYDDHNAKAKAS